MKYPDIFHDDIAEEVARAKIKADIRERAGDPDDHYYGAWNTGSGGRGAPESSDRARVLGFAAEIKRKREVKEKRIAAAALKAQRQKEIEQYFASLSPSQKEWLKQGKDDLLHEKVAAQEAMIRGLDHEEARVFNAKGRVIAKAVGEEDNVPVHMPNNKNARVLLHNHPGQDTPPSPQDMMFVFRNPEIRELRTVTSEASYIARPNLQGKWGQFDTGVGTEGAVIDAIDYQLWASTAWKDLVDRVPGGKVPGMDFSVPQVEWMGREFWRKATDRWGWQMERIPRAQAA